MDWGIVVSVLVAMAIFLAATIVLVLMMVGLFAWRIKKHMRKQGSMAFKLPDCCLMKSTQNSI
ncbi:MAG: hypothetical protein PHU70_00430 [Dehalococcoidia bacterium]|nr:hypothetical protein [Dehalococcoidia bacterium]